MIVDVIFLGWPPRSPDVMVCDFLLWGYLKEHVCYTHNFENHEDLKSIIEEELLQIPNDFVLNACNSLFEHSCQCVVVDGFQFE